MGQTAISSSTFRPTLTVRVARFLQDGLTYVSRALVRASLALTRYGLSIHAAAVEAQASTYTKRKVKASKALEQARILLEEAVRVHEKATDDATTAHGVAHIIRAVHKSK